MAKITASFTPPLKPFNSSQLKIGDMMITDENNPFYPKHILLRMYKGLVSLTDPTNTWSTETSITGRKLLPGGRVILTQK